MQNRSLNPKSRGYKWYGAQGITICPEWLVDRSVFYTWAIASGYRDGLQIDRCDGDKHYTPENCRWVTSQEQQNNRRNNTRIAYQGRNMTIAEWSRETSLRHNVNSARFHKGWPIEQVLAPVLPAVIEAPEEKAA